MLHKVCRSSLLYSSYDPRRTRCIVTSLTHVSRSYTSGISYNQPRFARYASWSANAITVLNYSQLSYQPASIFITTSNKWYVATDGYGSIVSGIGSSTYSTISAMGGYCLFVTANGDVYSYDHSKFQITRSPINATTSLPVMLVNDLCRGLFIDTNNTLYCAILHMAQVVAKSLDDPTNTLNAVAGTGCYGSASNQLSSPAGIFVDLAFNLFVADIYNHRIQRFSNGQKNGTTVAGNGVSGTITLNSPTDVVLDGDGYVFIVDTGNHRVIGSGPAGFRCIAGCSNVSGSARDQLSSPQSMGFDSDGNIWVADYSNRRVQKFVLKTNSSGKHYNLSFDRQCEKCEETCECIGSSYEYRSVDYLGTENVVNFSI